MQGPARKRLFVNECNHVGWDTYRQLAVRTQGIIFLDYNISDSSVLYCVNLSKLELDPDNATTQTSLSSGIEAEAFIQFESQGNTDIVYMMTKNHGFYKIDVSSGTPSVSEA